MKKNISIISIIFMMCILAMFPTNLKAENPEWMYFHELESIRGLEAIGNFIYIGLSGPNSGTRRLNLETLKLDTIDPIIYSFSFKEDSKGNVWVGTAGMGLWETRDNIIVNKFDHTNSNLKQYNNGPNLEILSIAIDKYDNKWLATDTGLVRFDEVDGKFFAHRNPKWGIRYSKILLDNDGESLWLWNNIDFKGIMKFSNENFIIFDTSNSGVVNPLIRGLDIDNENNLWMVGQYIPTLASSGELIKYDGVNWEHYEKDNPSLAQLDTDSEVKIDNEGTKWIGTRKGGLIKYDDITWTQFNTDNSDISGNRIERIVIDKYGNKWLSVSESGINGFSALEVFREGGVLLPTNVQDYIRERDSKAPVVYPNPAQDIIKVTDLIKRERLFEISNIMGKVILHGTFYHEIDVSSLPTGFYFLKVDKFRLKFTKN